MSLTNTEKKARAVLKREGVSDSTFDLVNGAFRECVESNRMAMARVRAQLEADLDLSDRSRYELMKSMVRGFVGHYMPFLIEDGPAAMCELVELALEQAQAAQCEDPDCDGCKQRRRQQQRKDEN